MSVLIIQRIPGDTDQFQSFMAANAELVEQLTERAKREGCRGHRFAIGDGEVVVVDEWDSAAAFETFISAPELQSVMGDMGARGEPQVTVAEAKGFPGEF